MRSFAPSKTRILAGVASDPLAEAGELKAGRGATATNRVPAWVTRRRFSVADYHRMGESGVLEGDERVELIEGEVTAMAPVCGPHVGAVIALHRLLFLAVGDRALVSVRNPIRLGDRSEPEPDVALLRPRQDRYRGPTPPMAEEVAFLVEVAESSLRFDREVKLPLHARHGIPEVWIVDLVGAAVDVHHAARDGRLAVVERLGGADVLEPRALPGVRIAVAEVLSG